MGRIVAYMSRETTTQADVKVSIVPDLREDLIENATKFVRIHRARDSPRPDETLWAYLKNNQGLTDSEITEVQKRCPKCMDFQSPQLPEHRDGTGDGLGITIDVLRLVFEFCPPENLRPWSEFRPGERVEVRTYRNRAHRKWYPAKYHGKSDKMEFDHAVFFYDKNLSHIMAGWTPTRAHLDHFADQDVRRSGPLDAAAFPDDVRRAAKEALDWQMKQYEAEGRQKYPDAWRITQSGMLTLGDREAYFKRDTRNDVHGKPMWDNVYCSYGGRIHWNSAKQVWEIVHYGRSGWFRTATPLPWEIPQYLLPNQSVKFGGGYFKSKLTASTVEEAMQWKYRNH